MNRFFSRTVVAVGTGALVLAGSAAAFAFWSVTSRPASVTIMAAALPSGSRPAVIYSSGDITVSWPAAVPSVDGYQVIRYGIGDATEVCSMVQATRCVDESVPAGTWTYTVRPRHGTSWIGPESPPSPAIEIAPAEVTIGAAPTTPPSLRRVPARTTPPPTPKPTASPIPTPLTSNAPESTPLPSVPPVPPSELPTPAIPDPVEATTTVGVPGGSPMSA